MGPPRDSEQTAGHPSLFRASSPASTAWDTTKLYATFFPAWPSPTVPGDQQRRAVCRATSPAHPSEKSALGEDGGFGGKEGPLCASQGALLPPETSHVRPLARTCESGNGFLYSCVGRATTWHTAMSRGPGPKTPVMARERAFLPVRSRSHANRGTLSTRLSGPVFHYLTAPAEQQRIL